MQHAPKASNVCVYTQPYMKDGNSEMENHSKFILYINITRHHQRLHAFNEQPKCVIWRCAAVTGTHTHAFLCKHVQKNIFWCSSGASGGAVCSYLKLIIHSFGMSVSLIVFCVSFKYLCVKLDSVGKKLEGLQPE